jgi:hypothetical protein
MIKLIVFLRRQFLKRRKRNLRVLAVLLFIVAWLFSGYPQVFNFPPSWQFVLAAQFGRPDSNTGSSGTWSGSYASINSATPDDGTSITAANTIGVGAYFEVGLSDVDDPGILTGHIVRYRYGVVGGGNRQYGFQVTLLQGSTSIASWTHAGVTAGPFQANQTLSTAEANSITDYTNLRIRFTITGNSGGGPRVPHWYWAEFEVPDAPDAYPVITTNTATNISQISATGNAEITDTGGGSVTSRGFVWSTSSQPNPGDVVPTSSGYESNVNQGGSFSVGSYNLSLTGLSPGTTYYYRAYAQNTQGYAYGNEVSFTTLADLPSVETGFASSILQNQATGNGNVISTGGVDITERGFVWSTSSQSDPGNVAPGSSGYANTTSQSGTYGAGVFSLSITSLSNSTTYYYRAYALNSEGYAYGNEVEFTTLGDFATVTTQAPTSIEQTSVTGRGNITDTGAANPTERGFVWSTSSQANPGNIAPGGSGYSGNVSEGGSFGTGAFSLSISGLTHTTTYYYRAYALNSEGYSYGNEISFSTKDQLPAVSTSGASALSTRSVTGNGSVTNTGGLTITNRGFVWSASSQPTTPGNVAPASSGYDFSNSESGTFGTGTYSLTIADLDPNTTYYYRSWAQNTAGYAYGNQVSFTTNDAQFGGPGGDISTGGWTVAPLYPKVGTATREDSSFISSDDNTATDTAVMAMAEIDNPGVNTGHVMRYTYRKSAAGGHAIDFTIRLMQGATVIAEWTHTNISDSFVLAEQILTETQASNITNYAGLSVEVIRGGDTGGGPTTRRSAQVSWIELETPKPLPISLATVTTSAASNIGVTQVGGNGAVTNTGNTTIIERGFVWSTTSHLSPGNVAPGSSGYSGVVNETGSFSAESFSLSITDLTASTFYYYRAYAQNSEGYSYGGELSFQTYAETPTVTTSTPTSIMTDNVDGRGSIIFSGLSAVTERGFVWSTSSQSDPGNVAPGSSGYANVNTDTGSFFAGDFSQNIAGLDSDTTYYYRAYARNTEGYGYGSEIEFQTPGIFATLTTGSPTNLTETSADGQGNITHIGVSSPTRRGFVLGTTSLLNPGDVGPNLSGYDSYVDETGTFNTGAYSLALSTLIEGIVYYYRAFVENIAGFSYGNEVMFNTPSARPTLQTYSATSVLYDRVTGQGEIVATGLSSVTERGFVWGTSSYSNPGNLSPAASDYVFNISQTGTFGTGNYALELTSLDDSTTYYYRAYARNSDGYAYGSEIVFTTPEPPLPPEITDVILNEEEPISLIEGDTTDVFVSATVSDGNGFDDLDESSAYAIVYRSGVGTGCVANDNNCYITADCSLVQVDATSGSVSCVASLQFFAEATDIESPYSAEEWRARVYISDFDHPEVFADTIEGVDLYTLYALAVIGDINYGILSVGEDTGNTNQSVVLRNTGNTAIAPLVSGDDMQSSSGILDAFWQKYNTAGFLYSSEGLSLSTLDEPTGLTLGKPISTTPVQGTLYWGIGLPLNGLPAENYEGTNYFTAAPPL